MCKWGSWSPVVEGCGRQTGPEFLSVGAPHDNTMGVPGLPGLCFFVLFIGQFMMMDNIIVKLSAMCINDFGHSLFTIIIA